MKRIAPILVLSAGILWGIIGIFVRELNILGFSAMDIVLIRAVATTLILGVFLCIYNRKLLMIKLKDIWCFIGTGLFSIVFFNYCYFKAITLTSLSVAAVLLYTAPAIVMVLSAILFREKINVIKVVSIVITFVGCVLVTGSLSGTSSLNASGILVGLGAGLGYALYSIFSRIALQKGYHSLTISFYTFLIAIVGSMPLANLKGVSGAMGSADTIGYCLIFALVSTVIPYIVYTLGLSAMDNSKASIIASVEPVVATVLGVIAYNERMSFLQVVGVVLVIGAIVLCNTKKEKKDGN